MCVIMFCIRCWNGYDDHHHPSHHILLPYRHLFLIAFLPSDIIFLFTFFYDILLVILPVWMRSAAPDAMWKYFQFLLPLCDWMIEWMKWILDPPQLKQFSISISNLLAYPHLEGNLKKHVVQLIGNVNVLIYTGRKSRSVMFSVKKIQSSSTYYIFWSN